ncbi:MAG: PIG-L deacetylase family protein, partial [Candidatus Ratteibacteria bacterium]
MNSKKITILLGVLSIFSWVNGVCDENTSASPYPEIKLSSKENIIVFAPHPDDEIIGCAGIIQECLEKQGTVYVVYLTNGDHN